MGKSDEILDAAITVLGPEVKKVTCKICSRRRDLYFVGSEIYCIDHTISNLVSLIPPE